MEESQWKKEKEKAGKTVRFRVAAANSGRVLAEVFKDETAWRASLSEPAGSEHRSKTGAEQGGPHPTGEANSHLNGLGAAQDENGCEPDDLLLYASAKREKLFSNKRVNICSKNGTIRGVRNKVSAGQVLFNNLPVHPVSRAKMYAFMSGKKRKHPPPMINRKEDPGKSSQRLGYYPHGGPIPRIISHLHLCC